jgi:hypothetical protein
MRSRQSFPFGALLLASLLRSSFAIPQEELGGARVNTEDGKITVTTDVGRPLYFSIIALSETFGWVVDYEDPVYSGAESRDATAPSWLHDHPNGRHFYAPADGKFSASLGKINGANLDEFGILQRLITLYNQSINPGSFELMRTSHGRVSVLGRSRFQSSSSVPVLSHDMRPSRISESASEAVQEVVTQCGATAGVPIEIGTVPSNALSTTQVEGHDGTLSCREQVGRILTALGHPVRYALLYDINTRSYYLNIVPAHRLVAGPDGKQTVAPL